MSKAKTGARVVHCPSGQGLRAGKHTSRGKSISQPSDLDSPFMTLSEWKAEQDRLRAANPNALADESLVRAAAAWLDLLCDPLSEPDYTRVAVLIRNLGRLADNLEDVTLE